MNQLTTGAEFVFALVLMLGVLITVHEFGHFLVAKLCGVRVLKFSIGFGSPIGFGRFRMRWTRGGTEYVVAWLPLGGFVKMLGENPDDVDSPETRADPAHALASKPTWQKLSVIFAGPAMNLALPVFIFAGTLALGIDRREAVLGNVEPGSPAAEAGLLAGDRVLAIQGEPVAWWDELEKQVRTRPGERLSLDVEREGRRFDLQVEVEERAGLDIFLLNSDVGWLGLQHARQKAVVGITSNDTPAARAGLRSGDRVARVGESPVEDWTSFAEAYARIEREGSVELTVTRGGEEGETESRLSVPALGSVGRLGVIPAVVLVESVSEGKPAERAGIEPGDLIVAVDGAPLGSFLTFQETVLASKGRVLEILVARDGETRRFSISPELTKLGDGGMGEELYLIGIRGEDATLPGALATDQVRNPFVAFPRAVTMTVDLTRIFLSGLQKIISGEISRRNIGGPIEIAKQSHMALQAGWDRFLNLLILISINLGILNLLPIPILDGGQALLFTVEGVKRSPLSLRTREIVQQLGLVVLVALMSFAFWNDLSRHWSSFLEWVKGL
jgi:regulator of sigma E protease